MRLSKQSVVVVLLALAAAAAASISVRAGEPVRHDSAGPAPARRWDKETVDVMSRLPVQDGGRVKPLSTFADFTLLALNGRRGVKTAAGELDPTRWLLDCLFFTDEAVRYECFIVQTDEVLDAVGLAHDGKSRRDRYSYADLLPARARIFELAARYSDIDEKRRSPVEGQLLNLAHNMRQFEQVAGLLGVIGSPPTPAESKALGRVFGDVAPRVGEILAEADELRAWTLGGHASPHATGGVQADDEVLRGWVDQAVDASHGLALIPPAGDAKEWASPSDVLAAAFYRGEASAEQTAALRELDLMYASRGDAEAFRGRAKAFSDRVVATARGRGEYEKIPLEVTFYRAQFFHYAQVVFVLGFLFAAFSWIKPGKWLPRIVWANLTLATLLLAAGIVMRCVIRGRPPVTTLYESILFVTAVGVISAMAAEWFNRRGIALALAAVVGSAGMFLANKYEVQEHVDTMPSLVAVLDTNFWLASHVTTVTIGYGAGILAGLVGHVYVVGKLLGAKKNDPGFYKTLNSMTYGMLCFGLLFSVVGTVLGGIWANESWGRFWGWDPKENGALTIVLWQLIVLHARLGGYLRDFGVAMASVFGTAVVASSWWGVNLLGVGLHSYGFTSGILWALLGFYGFEALVLLAGGLHWTFGRAARAAPAPGAALPPLPARADTVSGGVR